MKFFTGLIATETNTFAPAPTGWVSYNENGLFHGDGSLEAPAGFCGPLAVWREMAEAEGHQLVESVAAYAQPGGRTLDGVYEALRDELLADLRQALPVDGVLLCLHGAMAAQSYDDCEGDLLQNVREIVGASVTIGVELDPHCHMTSKMMTSADIQIAYKEYPHSDILERAREVYRLTADAANGLIRPTTAWRDCRMVNLWHTTREPMVSFVEYMKDLERQEGILSVSFGHGFPWGDTADSGAKTWAITDGDPEKAAEIAEALRCRIWDEREVNRAEFLTVNQVLDAALAVQDGPAVIADVADNAGGGAPSDSTFLLKQIVERGISDVAMSYFWDLGAVFLCRDAGVGAALDLRIGGKCGPTSGEPVDLRVTVMGVMEDHSEMGMGLRWPHGPTVWVRGPGAIDILLTSIRSQAFHPSGFTDFGIDLTTKRLIVVKSTQHFRSAFAPLAGEIFYAATPGAISPIFEALPYKSRPLNYWPRVEDPFAI